MDAAAAAAGCLADAAADDDDNTTILCSVLWSHSFHLCRAMGRETIHNARCHTQTNCIKVECIINNDPQSVLLLLLLHIATHLVCTLNDIIIRLSLFPSKLFFPNLLFRVICGCMCVCDEGKNK